MTAARLYVLICASVHAALFSLALFSPHVGEVELSGAQFLATIGFAWGAIFQRSLTPKHLFTLLFSVIVMAALAYAISFSPLVKPDSGRYIAGSLEAADLLRSAAQSGSLLQLFSTLLISTGLWMRSRRQPYMIRRAANTREERDGLYLLREHIAPNPISSFKYIKFLINGGGYVLERDGDTIAFIRYMLLENFAILFDFIRTEETKVEPGRRYSAALLRSTVEKLSGYAPILIVADSNLEGSELLRDSGFQEISSPDNDLIILLKTYRMADFPDWKPFDFDFTLWSPRQSDALSKGI